MDGNPNLYETPRVVSIRTRFLISVGREDKVAGFVNFSGPPCNVLLLSLIPLSLSSCSSESTASWPPCLPSDLYTDAMCMCGGSGKFAAPIRCESTGKKGHSSVAQ